MPLEDDVIPSAPPWDTDTAQAAAGEQEEFVEDAPDVDDSVFDTVPTEPETMKRGVFHFRLDSYEKKSKDGQPYFNIKWVCQQEPNTGRVAWDMATGVNKETAEAAKDTNHPNHEAALKLCKNRLWKQKQIMKAAHYRAPGMNFQTFMDTNPEIRIAGDPVQRMKSSGQTDPKTGKPKYVPDGTKKNWKVKEYLPL